MTPKRPSEEAIDRILNAGVRPHAPKVAEIGFSGDVAVVVFEPGEEAKRIARVIGWDGESPVFRLPEDGRLALAGSATLADTGIARWLGRKLDPAAPVARVLVLTGDRPLLMNFSPYEGWSLEPGATGSAMVN